MNINSLFLKGSFDIKMIHTHYTLFAKPKFLNDHNSAYYSLEVRCKMFLYTLL